MECTDMPPYAVDVQEATELPVFDLSTLTNMVAEGRAPPALQRALDVLGIK